MNIQQPFLDGQNTVNNFHEIWINKRSSVALFSVLAEWISIIYRFQRWRDRTSYINFSPNASLQASIRDRAILSALSIHDRQTYRDPEEKPTRIRSLFLSRGQEVSVGDRN